MSKLSTKPSGVEAIPTKAGWVHPATGELLVCIKGLLDDQEVNQAATTENTETEVEVEVIVETEPEVEAEEPVAEKIEATVEKAEEPVADKKSSKKKKAAEAAVTNE